MALSLRIWRSSLVGCGEVGGSTGDRVDELDMIVLGKLLTSSLTLCLFIFLEPEHMKLFDEFVCVHLLAVYPLIFQRWEPLPFDEVLCQDLVGS
jgi:hypothetical protein